MRIDIPRKSTPFFSEKQRLFTENQAALQEWIQAPFSKEAFENQWIEKRKSYGQVQRYLLHRNKWCDCEYCGLELQAGD